ncbi:ty1-copia retrotransposon protein [Cucumis melo var. makuwa]|uniref:Ty1-copia retrotransposon protein n=1 Tax=Cucumis melo var. makuwa TaxID=1194695 RepID=A0A5A7UAK1_CUCMM|nr:ty1-copia retrotransposon protein [Cucumis melo var. makuwa]TYK19230.1 ty1-copia retrotransposon protein [Cucumis melo var. makuwa]
MTDDKQVVEQIHEYENLVANILFEGMKMCEILQENVLLEKFPLSWNDYRNHLKHKKKDLKLQELISYMRMEEANRLKDKLGSKNLNLEGHKSYQRNQRKGRPNEKPTPQANLVEQDNEIIATIVNANLIENKTDWILDTEASRYFCTNRELLHDYKDTADGECVFMRNSATVGVIEKGKVILKLTSGKTLSLSNVLYVSSLHRNLVSESLLNRAGLKIVLEGDKVVLTKNEEFVDKGYLSNGLFVLNIVSMNANASSFAYMIESVNLWHGSLGHVNFASIRKLKDLRLINTSESHEIVRTSLDASKHLKKNKGDSVSQPEYAKIIDNDEVNSTSGYVFLLGGGVISWKSAKQTCIARSTMESEFIALKLAEQEAEWIKNLLGDVPLWGTSVPVSIQCDSQAAICIAKNNVYNGKSRHIRLRHAVVKQLLKEGTISLEFVRFEKNLANPLTKGLTRKVVLDSSVNMGLKPFGDP